MRHRLRVLTFGLLYMVVIFTYVTLRIRHDHMNVFHERQSQQKQEEISQSFTKSHRECPNILKPPKANYSNGNWQMFQDGRTDETVYVISAFLDDRTVTEPTRFLRILAVSRHVKGDLFCQIWYADKGTPHIANVAIARTGRGDIITGVKYEQSLYSCPIPDSFTKPSHVSITTSFCQNSSIYMPVTIPDDTMVHEFGVCVAISFGKTPSVEFIEWMEINRIFGVTEFNIYDGNISPDMKKLFQYYKDVGVLRVHPMPPPIKEFSVKGVKLSSPASLNDCMMRNMYRYRYIVVIDFDEVIVPHNEFNYTAMLREIDKLQKLTTSPQSYTFRNEAFYKHFPQDTSQPEHLKMLRFRNHAQASSFLHAPKSFLDPRRCLSAFNHYCYIRFTKDRNFTVDVDTSIATSHHYRKCDYKKVVCDKQSKQIQLDNTLLKFKDELNSRVQHVIQCINNYVR